MQVKNYLHDAQILKIAQQEDCVHENIKQFENKRLHLS